jgi:Secretion system C-terminal sorting domain/META domain
MKKSLLVLLVIFSANCFGQNPDPNLFQTWYLSFLQLSDGNSRFNISKNNLYVPPGLGLPYIQINLETPPTLNILPNLQIIGNGACNSFTGVLNNSVPNYLQSTAFVQTLRICTSPDHSSFENDYFQLFRLGGSYNISPVEGGLVLMINTPIFGQAVFYNFNLSSKAFTTEPTSLCPNPCGSSISLHSKSVIEKVEIYNVLGQNCKSVYSNFETIDTSKLETGTYIFKIYDENGTFNKKIIKE